MIADFVQVDYSDSLVEPTFRGLPWSANTSFQNEPPRKGLVVGRADHWRDALTLEKRTWIEEALYADMVAFGYMSRITGLRWWLRLRVTPLIRRSVSRLMASVRLLLPHARFTRR